jgi:Protein of unknown function (DUF2809)
MGDIIKPLSDPELEQEQMTEDARTTTQTTIFDPDISGRSITYSVWNLISKDNSRILKVLLMAMVFITALSTKSYTGDFKEIINNQMGGAFYVLFGSLLISLIIPRWSVVKQVLLAFGITCLHEFVQWFQFPFMVKLTQIKTFAYLFGNSFNVKDFAGYALGALLGFLVLMLFHEKKEEQRK